MSCGNGEVRLRLMLRDFLTTRPTLSQAEAGMSYMDLSGCQIRYEP